ncbi:hypothetical protein Acr_00g0008110 [Actinidia rufa]|uniref:Retrotransposon gag domain-containing protein n=1 Tax=Actinidia rufa TaxID=165716 RepID=A0A7J0D8K2_9ERIC|nr:hypothetical protein Acr_00g0008110 [Actinidia rufa]
MAALSPSLPNGSAPIPAPETASNASPQTGSPPSISPPNLSLAFSPPNSISSLNSRPSPTTSILLRRRPPLSPSPLSLELEWLVFGGFSKALQSLWEADGGNPVRGVAFDAVPGAGIEAGLAGGEGGWPWHWRLNIARHPSYEVPSPHLERQTFSPNPLDRGKTSPWDHAKSSPLSSPEPPSERSLARQELGYCLLLAIGRGSRRDPWTQPITPSIKRPLLHHSKKDFERPRPGPLFLFVCAGRPLIFRGPVPRNPSNIDCCRNLPRPSASSPLDNRAPPMANASQVPDLEGLHHEIHGMAEQMRVMNENNARLIQLLAAANPQPPAAPSVPDVERSRHSNRSGDRSHNVSTERARVRRRAPSPSLCERSSSSESSHTRARVRRGRSPNRGDHTEARDKSTSQKIRDLDARLDTINTGTNAPVTVDALVRQTDPPFTKRVLGARISSKFKLPTQLGIYEGKTDPMDHLDSYKKPNKNASHLFTVHQKETESLKDFVKRFNQAILEVKDPSDKVIIMAMMEGLRPGPLFDSLSKNVPETLSALQSKADKYIAAEELAEAKRRRRGKDDHKRKEPDTRRNDYREETRYKRPDRDPKRSNNRRPRTPPRRPEFILPPLNALVAQVLSEIKHEEFVKWPGKIKTDPQKRNRNKYCEFHRDHGHNTEDCFQLKEQIADLIKRGYLRKYITDRPPPNSPERRYGDNRPTAGNIQTIHGGFRSGGCSTSSRKKHARSAFRSVEEEVYNLSSPCVGDQPPITFSSDDLRGLHLPHDDALDFIVVDCPSPYNAILGRPTLGGIKAITSTYHLKMKFPTLTGIGEKAGDDAGILRGEMEQLILEDPKETENTKPLEEVVPISIHPNYPDRQVMIGTELTDELRIALIDFLKKNSDVFAWSQATSPVSTQKSPCISCSPNLSTPQSARNGESSPRSS